MQKQTCKRKPLKIKQQPKEEPDTLANSDWKESNVTLVHTMREKK